MQGRVTLAAIAALALAGCTTPLVSPNLITAQPKTEHAVNWRGLARQVVLDREKRILGNAGRPIIFVAPGPADMPFAQTYRAYLEEAFLKKGYQVRETAEDGVEVVNFEVRTYYYGRGNKKLPGDYASLYTTVAAGGGALRNVSDVDTGIVLGGVGGVLLDVFIAMNSPTSAEAVLTTTISDGTHLFYRDIKTFYVHPRDLPFYWTQTASTSPQIGGSLKTVSLPIANRYRSEPLALPSASSEPVPLPSANSNRIPRN